LLQNSLSIRRQYLDHSLCTGLISARADKVISAKADSIP
jgi:hypothetical protein